jgi:hypothetical protein
MNKRIFRFAIIASLFTSFTSVNAQNDTFWLEGHVRDNFTDTRIDKAKVYLLSKDSVIRDSTQVTIGDIFSFRVKRDKSFRSCIIKVTHPGYQTLYSTHSLKYVGKNAFFTIPTIFLKRKNTFTEQTLKEVVVTATKVKMFYRGDTLVYNADAFNVANGSMLDALIRQMPGTELTKEGEIYVNGKKVDNLLLNGKDFFRGNNKLMMENLPYYTVKEIKVYDQTTEKAKALHDDRAEKDFVMDVNLKREYSKGYMANIGVGAGTEDAYLARLFGLSFTDVSRLAVVGGTNNLNMSDYSFSGYANDAGSREGRTYSKLLTAELMTEHKRNKNVLTVELSRKKSEQGADVYQETFHNESSTFSTTQNSSTNKNIGVSLSNKYTLKLPFWLESTTNLRFNSKKEDSNERYFESSADTRQQGLAVLDSLFSMGVAINDPSIISARKRWVDSKKKEYGASQNFAFAKNLYSSDIIEFSAGAEYNKSTDDTERFNRYLTWNSGLTQNDITELIDHPDTHVGLKTDASYKISRLLYNTDLKFFAGYRFNHDKDRETITDAVSSVTDVMNSYNRRMTENIYIMGLNYHYDYRNLNKNLRTEVNLNLPLSVIDRSTDYTRYTLDTCLTQSPVFFEPSLTVSHKKWRDNNNISSTLWRVAASTSLKYTLPDATQLITLPLTSDKINIYQGNDHLKSPAVWESSLTWNIPMKRKYAYLIPSLTYTSYINRIINTYRYDAGVYTNKPDNVNGTSNLEFSTRGQQFITIAKCPTTITYGLKSNYQKMKNFVADGTTGQSRQIDNDELHSSANVRFWSHYKSVALIIRLSTDWRKPLNDRADMGYRDTWEYKGEGWLTVNLPAGIDLETDCVVLKRQGYSNDELNKLTCEWNMNLSKSILKNQIDLSLKAIDILRQYKSVAYIVNERGICETRAVTLPSYLLFSVTYKINKQPKKKL